MSGLTCIAEEDGNAYHLNFGIRELRLPKGYRLNIAGCRNPGSVTVEKWEQPWTGKGLPPVGTVCEYIGIASSVPHGSVVDIVTHLSYANGDMAVYAYRHKDNPVIGQAIEGKFRPLCTPEQIAAEERAAIAKQACSEIESAVAGYNETISCTAAIRATVDAMVAAGYRKVQP